MAPAARAVLIASGTIDAAPLPEPALPARSRIPAITGAPVAVADRGRQRRQALAEHLLPGDLGVAVAGALLGVPERRPQQRVDVDEDPARRSRAAARCAATRLTRCARSTEASCRLWPWVNSRRS